MNTAMKRVHENRCKHDDAFYYNWSLHIDEPFQHEFDPTHENMASLNLHKDQSPASLAANLRRAFSGVVAGNIKPNGIKAIKEHGVYKLNGDPVMMKSLDKLLTSFADQQRMKLSGKYIPCYDVITQ